MMEKLSNLIGEVPAKQLVYKSFKEVSKEMASQLGEARDICDIVTKVYGSIVTNCSHKGEDEVVIVLERCPWADVGHANPVNCVVPIALGSGIIEAILGKDVKVVAPSGRYGHSRAEVTLKIERCGLLGGNCIISIKGI